MIASIALLATLTVTPAKLDSHQLEALAAVAWQQAEQVDPKHQKDVEKDIELGKKYAAEIEKELKLSENQAMVERVQRIGGIIAKVANENHAETLWGDKRFSKFEYTFKVIADDDVNAFSLPGGFIFVNEGLLTYVESDDELAGVLAHEVAHASLRHVATIQREMSKRAIFDIPLLIAVILSGASAESTGLLTIGQAAGIDRYTGWSRQAEKAADFAGLQYLLKTDYNATGMLTVVERLARDERLKPKIDWGIYQTHPPNELRAVNLTNWMKERDLVVQRSAVTRSFSVQLKPQNDGTVQAWFDEKLIYTFGGEGANERAEAAKKTLDAFFDSTPGLVDIQEVDGRIVGRGKTLFTINPEDLVEKDGSVDALAETTVKGLRNAVFALNYQIWQPSGQ